MSIECMDMDYKCPKSTLAGPTGRLSASGSLVSRLPACRGQGFGGELNGTASLVAWLVRRLLTMGSTLGQEDFLGKEMATCSSILDQKIPLTEEQKV